MLYDGRRQISVNDVAALAQHASIATSYKPALLKAIVRIVRSGGGPLIDLTKIGHAFVELYWVQTIIFHLRQAATIHGEPEVPRRIRDTAVRFGVRHLAELPVEAREQLDRDIAKVLTINVLGLFHKSAPVDMPELFAWEKGRTAIALSEDSLAFVKSSSRALETIANHWWARKLEKVNMLAPLVIEKVERHGLERRNSLARYLKILKQTDAPECFYCERPIDGIITHVDHVIPWSFLLTDDLWDLVIACAPCNLAKSDRLPEREYLNKLFDRSVVRSRLALSGGIASALIGRNDMDRLYDAALSVEWPSGWRPTPYE